MNIKDAIAKIVDLQNLSQDAAKKIMTSIMTGETTEAQIASFITALRMKGETPEEIAGLAEAMAGAAVYVKSPDPDTVDSVGTGGDGSNTINISTGAAIVAAGAGVTVAKHGNKSVSSKSGAADILSALGINISIDPSMMEKCLEKAGFAFLFAPSLHPAMKYAIGPRKEIGIRTVFNILGPMTNPARVKRGVIGVFNEHYCRLLADAMSKIDCRHMIFVHGKDGLDEITLTAKTIMLEVKDGIITESLFDPVDFGFDYCKIEDLKGGSPAQNAEHLRNVLSGKMGPHRDIIVLNSSATLMASGKFFDWHDAIDAARKSIDSGKAMEKLEQIIEITNQ